MMSKTGKQVITTHIMPSILRNKDNQTMKFDQLVEFNTRNIFFKIIRKCGGKPRPFPKKSKISISLDQQSKVLYSLLLLYVQVEDYRNILKIRCRPLDFTSYKAFFVQKKKSEIAPTSSFFAQYLKKNISHVILY